MAVSVAQQAAPMPRGTLATLQHAPSQNAIVLAQARQVD